MAAVIDAVYDAWQQHYGDQPFVRVRKKTQAVEVLNTTGTNFCDIAAVADERTLMITSVLDNLVKGAAGQAVQNLNLMYGLPQGTGLLQAPY